MKRLIGSVILTFLLINIYAQAPQYISYQAVVRNATGGVLPNKLVSFRISIIQGTALGSSIYTEIHNKATNEFGLVTLKVGGGAVVTGNFANIDWSLGTYFMKVELDVDAGSNYAFMGTTQILSVPYALYAEKAGNAADDYDKDSLNEIQSINKTGNIVTLSNNGGSYTDSDNQTLALNGNLLTISDGNTLPIDADTLNEIQIISKTGNVIELSQNGGSYTDNDNQVLTLNGTNLTISNGNSLNIGGTVDLDYDPTNEIQNLTLINDTLILSQSNQVYLPYDKDSANELQNISKNGNLVTLSHNGGSFTDSDAQNLSSTSSGTDRTINISNGTGTTLNIADNDNNASNELQFLSYNEDTLNLSQGNFVVLPISQIVPSGFCIQSTNPVSPSGYSNFGEHVISDEAWKTNPDIPFSPSPIKAINLNDNIYVVCNVSSSTKLYKYNPINNTWTFISNAPTYRYEYAIVGMNNSIYILGGYFVSTAIGLVEEYNLTTGLWSTKAPIPSGRSSFCANVVNGKIYVLGGTNNSGGYINTIQEYNPANNIWSTKYTGLERVYFSSAVVNSKIYIIGGSTSGGVNTNIVYVFNTTNNNMTTVSNFPNPMIQLTANSINEKIFVLGDTHNIEYNTLTDTWVVRASIPTSTFQHASVCYHNSIYVFGGNGQQESNRTYYMPITYFIHCKN